MSSTASTNAVATQAPATSPSAGAANDASAATATTQTPATSATAAQSATTSSQPAASSAATTQAAAPPAAPAPAPAAPAAPPPVAFYNIQSLGGWVWCTATMNGGPCASGLGNANSSMGDNQQTPSLSGKSAVFALSGPTAYSNALWWKSLGQVAPLNHLTYDLYFYIDDSSKPEALEFDVNQSYGGQRFTWGTECSYKNTGKWDVWNPSTLHWEATQVPCPQVSPKTWHHLVWQLERVNGQVHYVSVTVDDQQSSVDLYFNPQENWSGEDIDVAFQMDGDWKQDGYNVWLDQVSLKGWY